MHDHVRAFSVATHRRERTESIRKVARRSGRSLPLKALQAFRRGRLVRGHQVGARDLRYVGRDRAHPLVGIDPLVGERLDELGDGQPAGVASGMPVGKVWLVPIALSENATVARLPRKIDP